MNSKQEAKLERYFKNTGGVFWGLVPGNNQKEIYQWLRDKGYGGISGPYGNVIRRFLEDPGIEGIISEIIIPRIEDRFSREAMKRLRNCWKAGSVPDDKDLQYLKAHDYTSPFIEVDEDSGLYKWSVFAGLWFEEIEKMHEQENDDQVGKGVSIHVEQETHDCLIKIGKIEDKTISETLNLLCDYYENRDLIEKTIRLEAEIEELRKKVK